MMMIPSNIRYPAMIFGLLGLTLTVNIILVVAVHSDGGAQVVDDYYAKSTDWDKYAATRSNSEARQWALTFVFERGKLGRLEVLGADKKPVEGLVGKLHLRRPQFADEVGFVELRPMAGSPGVYEFQNIAKKPGIWDIVVEGEYDGQPVVLQHRQKIQ